MSFLKRIFGFGGSGETGAAQAGKSITYQGYVIRAEPFKSEGQYQTAGTIEKEVAGIAKSHRFIRADRHASYDQAEDFALAKGRQIIDEQGERIFD